MGSSDDPNPKKVTMSVGDRRKAATRTVLSELSPGYLLGPASYLRSSNRNIVQIHGEVTDSVVFVEALAPGEVVIDYGDLTEEVTRIVVKPGQAEQGSAHQSTTAP